MLQRQIGTATVILTRHSCSELTASPAAIPRGGFRNDGFCRRITTGCPGSSLLSLRSSRTCLAASSIPNGPLGDNNASDTSPSNQLHSHGHGESSRHHEQQWGSSSMHAHDPTAPFSSSPLRNGAWDFMPEPYVPSPANLPTSDDEDLLYPPRSLQPVAKDLWTLTNQPGIDLFLAGPLLWSRLRRIYVILFGIGQQRHSEGIYSLRAFKADGTPHETIISFEDGEEAQRYACLLEAAMDHTPHVCAITPAALLTFCLGQSYSCRLEPRGSLLIPPDYNVAITDWERSLRLRDGKFTVLDSEPELPVVAAARAAADGSSGMTAATAGTEAEAAAAPAASVADSGGSTSSTSGSAAGGGRNLLLGAGGQPTLLARYSGLGGEDLEEVRARLELLLPA